MRTAVCPTCGAKRLKWATNALGMRYLADFETGVEHYKTCSGVKVKPGDGPAPGEPEREPDASDADSAKVETGESESGDAADSGQPDDGETSGDGESDSGESADGESGETESESDSGEYDAESERERQADSDTGAGSGDQPESGDDQTETDSADGDTGDADDSDEPDGGEPEPETGDQPETETDEADQPGDGESGPRKPDEPEPEPEPAPSEPEPESTDHKLQARLNAYVRIGLNVMTVGPAGGGKTTAARIAAEHNGLEYFEQSVGPQTSQWDLIGFIGPNGEYHPGSMYLPFKHGGLAMLDEVDAGNPGILVVLNSLMANGHYRFPNGEEVQRHPDFRLVAGANTYGRGADRMYVGRAQLDAATLDRFAVIDWEYDERIESTWAGDGSGSWVRYVQAVRKVAFDLRMRFVVSPRASINGARMLRAGIAPAEVEESVLWKGLDRNERSKFSHLTFQPDQPATSPQQGSGGPEIDWARYHARAERERAGGAA